MTQNPNIILDTDIGYDPDDLFALLFLHKIAKYKIALITTANEMGGKRLKFLSQILKNKECRNYYSTLVSGSSLGLDKFTVDTMLKDAVFLRPNHLDYLIEMANVVNTTDNVIYIGIGGFTNLANFIDHFPKEAKKMKIFMMGGALDYERYPNWIEYNVKIDPKAVEKVINADLDITLIMAQTTHDSVYEVTAESMLYKKCKQSDSSLMKLLCEHCDLWFEQRGHGTSMHDPLTVATALGMDFVTLNTSKVSFKDNKFVLDKKHGHTIKWSDSVSKSKEFMDFLEKTLLT